MSMQFKVEAYGATVALFNSFEDANDFAVASSAKYRNSWHEVKDAQHPHHLYKAYKEGVIVYDPS